MSNPEQAAVHHRPTVLRDRLDETTCRAVVGLVEQAAQADGTPALNEHALLALRAGSRAAASSTAAGAVRHVLGYATPARGVGSEAAGELVAYAQLDGPARAGSGSVAGEVAAECVVHPAHRRGGWGAAVLTRALREVGGAPLLLWSHGDHPGAAALAEGLGFVRTRELWQLRRRLGAGAPPLPELRIPPGVSVRSFRVGVDEQAWLELNARAFANHPEQGGTDATDLARRTGSGWFDPDGFFLAERGGRLVGFHWTKVHPAADGPAIGEVYVVGVDPDEQGSGLGSALTSIGLHHLADAGLDAVLLYVEADNAPALRVYDRLGFTHSGTDTQYRHAPSDAPVEPTGWPRPHRSPDGATMAG